MSAIEVLIDQKFVNHKYNHNSFRFIFHPESNSDSHPNYILYIYIYNIIYNSGGQPAAALRRIIYGSG